MTFAELLELFYKRTGRADLVNPSTYADLGAGNYINAGQRWLDRKMHGDFGRGRHFRDLDAGDYLVTIPEARIIESVWIYNTANRAKLSRKPREWVKKNYTGTPTGLTRGTPLYYAHEIIRSAQGQPTAQMNEFTGMAHMATTTMGQLSHSAILIAPPPDEDLSVEIYGKFYTGQLSAAGDSNFWSEEHYEMLLWAAFRQLEIDHRNTQGVNDWTNALMEAITDLDHDQVEQEIDDVDEIGDF